LKDQNYQHAKKDRSHHEEGFRDIKTPKEELEINLFTVLKDNDKE